MFNELNNFAFTRSSKEAFGFYCAYFLLIVLGAGVFSGAVGELFLPDMDPERSFELGQRIGAVVALIACMFLAYRILDSKQLIKNFSSYAYLAVTALCALLGGALLGMIPVAYLTTKSPAKVGENEPSPSVNPPASQSNLSEKS